MERTTEFYRKRVQELLEYGFTIRAIAERCRIPIEILSSLEGGISCEVTDRTRKMLDRFFTLLDEGVQICPCCNGFGQVVRWK